MKSKLSAVNNKLTTKTKTFAIHTLSARSRSTEHARQMSRREDQVTQKKVRKKLRKLLAREAFSKVVKSLKMATSAAATIVAAPTTMYRKHRPSTITCRI